MTTETAANEAPVVEGEIVPPATMSAEIAVRQARSLDVHREGVQYTRAQIDLLKRTVAKDTTDDELQLFIYQATRLGLDPFLKQVHAVKRRQKNDDGSWGESMAIQVGIDGFRLIADRTKHYAPGKESIYRYDDKALLISATSYVKKFTPIDGTWHEVSATAFYDEFVQTKRDGSANRMWATMPHVMLSKVSEAMALRKAFPAELSGVYVPEEMDQAENNGERDTASQNERSHQLAVKASQESRTATKGKSTQAGPKVDTSWHKKGRAYVADARVIKESKPGDAKQWKWYGVAIVKDGATTLTTTFDTKLYEAAREAINGKTPVEFKFSPDKKYPEKFVLDFVEPVFYREDDVEDSTPIEPDQDPGNGEETAGDGGPF